MVPAVPARAGRLAESLTGVDITRHDVDGPPGDGRPTTRRPVVDTPAISADGAYQSESVWKMRPCTCGLTGEVSCRYSMM
ncbi:hypothetical protein GCM10011354_02510 [Egicoccus halophilus]|uniref:Uncharacterized protein n=1 Tax=Egicoccus halophilus TaxID=1670830 RepID=A0A8J3A794_9ACTN|nr:hypothetical protein GCM10011354_02510 [Egicoccus halophilus]